MIFKINGYTLPTPARGMTVQRQQLVDSARNAKGEVVASKVNRRLLKFDGITFPHLTSKEWGRVLQEIEKFKGTVTFYDPLIQGFATMAVYWGDASEEPFKINPKTGEVLEYINCKCNIIDMGTSKRKVSRL